MPNHETTTPHSWKFSRIGGFDQVSLETWEDLAHLEELDQKLWVALSVPAKGLAIDEKSLALIDSDGDGHIRPPELLAAIAWAGAQLKDKELLAQGCEALPLTAVDDQEHPALLAALRHILAGLDKADSDTISVADTCEAVDRFAAQPLNGDGIIAPASSPDESLSTLIADLAQAYGGPQDRSGAPGVDLPLLEQFKADAQALLDWHAQPECDPACQSLGPATASAGAALSAVADKVEDYFTRCRLAAFDERAAALVNGAEAQFAALSLQNLAAPSEDMASLPLARVEAGRPLPLNNGLNPAWSAPMAVLVEQVLQPILGQIEHLTEGDWHKVRTSLATYTAWEAAQPASPVAAWETGRLTQALESAPQLEALINADLALQPEADAIAAADRITRYVRDLPRLLHNFVAFHDFYNPKTQAAFQAGTLYVDGRSCELVLDVLDPAKHVKLASLAGIYLLYCDCTRGSEKCSIAAAVTAGDADQLLVGRNGVFYDRKGQDWNATVTRVVEHPISLRQAFWSPYKKVARLVAEQVQKFAAAKSKSADDLLASKATAAAQPAPAPAADAKPAPFDVGKFAGIFAAIGLALGALGTAVASLVTGFLGLKAWQIPVALLGIMLLISGPAMAMAWFKLRNRSLAALLDANGWAVNARARINIPFGTSLTRLAALPSSATRSLQDPYNESNGSVGFFFVIGALVTLLILYVSGHLPI